MSLPAPAAPSSAAQSGAGEMHKRLLLPPFRPSVLPSLRPSRGAGQEGQRVSTAAFTVGPRSSLLGFSQLLLCLKPSFEMNSRARAEQQEPGGTCGAAAGCSGFCTAAGSPHSHVLGASSILMLLTLKAVGFSSTFSPREGSRAARGAEGLWSCQRPRAGAALGCFSQPSQVQTPLVPKTKGWRPRGFALAGTQGASSLSVVCRAPARPCRDAPALWLLFEPPRSFSAQVLPLQPVAGMRKGEPGPEQAVPLGATRGRDSTSTVLLHILHITDPAISEQHENVQGRR